MLSTPNIRFKGFTEPWEQRKLGEFGKATGGTSIESEFVDGGKYKVISIGSYSETGKYKDQGIRVNRTSKNQNRILNKNDLTMLLNDKTTTGNIIGRVLLIDADDSYIYNQRTERIEVYKNDFEPEFLYQLLNADNIRSKIIGASQGNTQIYVNWTAICELKYEIPNSKAEQCKIAEYFRYLDNLITLHQCKCDEMSKLKKFMLQKMFPKSGEQFPEIRFSGFSEPWEKRKLGEHCEMYNGDRSAKYPNANDMVEEGIPFINAGDLEDGSVNLRTCNKISREKYDDLGGAKLQMGDIVYCLRGTLGKNAFIDNFEEGTVASSLVAIRPKNINARYLYYILNSDIEYRQRIVHDEGAAQPNLSAKSVSEFEMPVPLIKEQEVISIYFTHLDHLITLHQRKCNEFKEIKKYMLQNMFPQKG